MRQQLDETVSGGCLAWPEDSGKARKRQTRLSLPALGVFLLGLGMVSVALAPMVQGMWTSLQEERAQAVYPLNIDEFISRIESGPKILADLNTLVEKEPLIVDELVDYGNIENWFGGQKIQTSEQTQESYVLEIEKLKIKNALVKVGGNNIDYNLVHFNPEAKIGDYGAPVIFGHSVLRQFYFPQETNKDRYKSIFSTIMTLNLGDQIKIKTGSITYTYVVTEKKEVKPDDDYILAQNTNLKQIKLVTCVPEGTSLRRGVVTAELKR